MTYSELMEQLVRFTPDQLAMDVTVRVSEQGEYYALMEGYPLVFAEEVTNDVLDAGHPYLVI